MKSLMKVMIAAVLFLTVSFGAFAQPGGGGPNCGADPDVSYSYQLNNVPSVITKGTTFYIDVDEIGTGSTNFCSIDIRVDLSIPFGMGTYTVTVGSFSDASTVNGTTVHGMSGLIPTQFPWFSTTAYFSLYVDGVLVETAGSVTIQ